MMPASCQHTFETMILFTFADICLSGTVHAARKVFGNVGTEERMMALPQVPVF